MLRAAAEAGATTLVLCDTNGGTLPTELKAVVARTVREFPDVEVGIHTHNDSGCGVANALVAVEAGATHVQGTINGIGERCGNCDLVTTIANLQLKMGLKVMDDERLRRLTEVSNYVSELMNLTPDTHRPYVGRSAFAHKGGLHVDGISKDPATYEHVAPEAVGNVRRTPVGELSGKNSIRTKAEGARARGRGCDPDPRRHKAARVRGLPLRGRRRLARATYRADHRGGQAALRVGDVQDHLREARRRGDDDGGDHKALRRRP